MVLKKILILSIACFILFSCGPGKKGPTVDFKRETDTLIFQRKFGDAEKVLLSSAAGEDKRVPLSEIIKRALEISNENRDYNFLVKISGTIAKKNPREEFYAVLVYALLRKGDLEGASKYAERHLVSKKWDSMHAEIDFKLRHEIPEKYGVYTLLTHSYYQNPDELFTIAEKTDNPALYLNAALLSVFTRKNQDLLPVYLEKSAGEYPYRTSLIAFHNFMFERLVKMKDKFGGIYLPAVADSYFILKNYQGAYDYLGNFYADELQKNWIAMFNYLWVKEKTTDKIDSVEIQKASRLFPGNPYFNLLFADHLTRKGRAGQAAAELDRIRDNQESNLVNAFYDFYLGNFPEERFLSYFWMELHNKGGEMDKNLLDFYLWYFCSTGNFSDLAKALQFIKDDIGDFYAAVTLAYYGFFGLSEMYFLKYAENHNYWEIYYNLFLISRKRGQLSKAGEHLSKAEEIYFSANSERSEEQTRLILQTIAEWEYKNGNNMRALEYLSIILQHDKTDSGANLLRDQIIGEGEDK